MSFIHLCQFSSKSSSKSVSEVRKNPVFDGLSSFLQLGVVCADAPKALVKNNNEKWSGANRGEAEQRRSGARRSGAEQREAERSKCVICLV